MGVSQGVCAAAEPTGPDDADEDERVAFNGAARLALMTRRTSAFFPFSSGSRMGKIRPGRPVW